MASMEKLTDAELLGLISQTTGGIQNQESQHITTDVEKVHEKTCSNVENHENSSSLSLETKVSSVLGGTFIHSDSTQSYEKLSTNDLNTEKPDSNLFASTTQSESDISSSTAFTVQTANQSDSNIVHPTVTQSVSLSSESSLVNSMSQSDIKLHVKDDMPSNVKSSPMSNLKSSLSAIKSSSSNTESSSYVKIPSTCELKSSSSSKIESPSTAQHEIPSTSCSQLNTCSNNVRKTMDKKSDCTNLSKEEAIKLVHECRTELEAWKKKLQRSERQLTKANDYNEVLRSMVEKLSSEIHRVKTVQTFSVHVQVDKEDFLNYTTGVDTMPKWNADDESMKMSVETSETPDVVIVTPEIPSTLQQTGSETDAISIADSIKQAAEAVVQQQQANMLQDQGYVYDDHSGLYYHPATGYYYDQHKSLFYDPKTGIYYYYDYDTGEYLFHSQIEIPAQNQTTEQPNFMDHDQSKKNLSKVRKSRNTARKKRDNERHSADDKVFKNRKERRQAEKENQLRNRSQHRRDSYHEKRERKRKYTDIVDSGESGNDRCQRSGERGHRSERKSKRGYRSNDRNERRGKRRSRSRSKRRHGKREYGKELKEMHSDENDVEVRENDHGERTKVKKTNEREKHTEPSAKMTKSKSIESTESKDCKLSSNDDVDDGDEDLIANSAEEFDLDSENEFIVIDDADEVIEIGNEEHVDDDDMNEANKSNVGDTAVNKKSKDDHHLNSMESNSRKSHEKKSERRHHHRERRSESSRSYHSHSDGSENEAESGELTDSDIEQSSESYSSYYSDTDEDMYEDMDGNESYEEEQEVAGSYPPCIRMMVLESDYLPVGTLHIVTCTGAKLGRENCDICIPDLNVSKVHAEIQYNEGSSHYEIYDHASQNGTFLNDQRLSPAKIASERFVLSHDDYVVISSTKLLCHIHSGSDTCDQCEPGVVIATHKAQQPQNEIKVLSKEERLRQKKQELNQIKKRYGLKNSAYENNVEVFNNPNYTDKAEERRKFVGSDVPGQKQEAPASVHRPISTGNVGHKMLQKMGWKEGDSLGKNNKGIQEPISVTLRASQKAGLGSASAGAFTADDANTVDMRKASRRLQAQQRFKQIEGNSEQKKQTVTNKSWTKGDTEFT